jgi:hypothetical protein
LFRRHSLSAATHGIQLIKCAKTSGVSCIVAGSQRHQQTAHTHHEELIEVGGGDGEELEAFEEWDGVVAGFIENSLVEFEPAEFAIHEHIR